MSEIAGVTVELKSGESCRIRTALPADAAQVLENAHANLAEPDAFDITLPQELDLTVAQEEAWIREHQQQEGFLCLVAEVADGIVGLINFKNGPRRRLVHRGAFGMSVVAAWRGRGVGDALLTALLDWARAHPTIEKVCLSVVVGNDPALGLYRKHGFREEGRRVREIKVGPDDYRDDILMYLLV